MPNLLLLIINITAGSFALIKGVSLLSVSLENLGKNKIVSYFNLKNLSLYKGFFIAIIITALIQSSSAISVITVSLVDSGLIGLEGAMGIIYGTNIGTTITAQLMAFNTNMLGIYILITGVLLKILTGIVSHYIHSKKIETFSKLCNAISGIGLMFTGISILHNSIPIIKNSQNIMNFINNYGNSIICCFLFGIFSTMLVHSSSATIALATVLFTGGLIGSHSAVSLILGDNIGTCITALVSSVGSKLNARRVAWGHTIYNIIGSAIALVFLNQFIYIVDSVMEMLGQNESSFIANTHTIFNILSAVIFLPLNKYYIKLIKFIIK